ncbi:MAG: NUDIX hydrolase [Pseudomonadota bacterium]
MVDFTGAKVALFIGDRLLVILRDEDRDIPWPGWWDFPGGGREAGETPEEVVTRETFEEVGLRLASFVWKREFRTSTDEPTFLFVAHLLATAEDEVSFGQEGQRWELWDVPKFMAHPKAIPYFKQRLQIFLHHQK